MNVTQRDQFQISVGVENADVLTFEADVLALKYAQRYYGVDEIVAERLIARGADSPSLRPMLSEIRLVESEGAIAAKAVLLVGVVPLGEFGYQEIREFGKTLLVSLAGSAASTRHLSLTIHGPGYGLDETEAFEAELAGLMDAVATGEYPERLERVTFVELNVGRSKRLSAVLSRLLPRGIIQINPKGQLQDLSENASERLRTAGEGAGTKPHIFVAMPFSEEMDDIFHYGIQGAVNAAGFLCERADLSTFTGDVMQWVKQRITSSALVVADLSAANPNVYLEVGYAWGCGIPTVLLVRNEAELTFDVKGHRYLVYKKIKDLEAGLRRELENLRPDMP
jgi:hypothetical protein